MSETLERLRNAGWRVEFGAKTPFLPNRPASVQLKHWQYGTFFGEGSTLDHALTDALMSATVAWGNRAN